MRPLWPSTTWNSWMCSRLTACESSIRSASPRVPTSEKARSRWSSAKSAQAAANSRLSAARCSASRRRQAGSSLRNVYLTKCLSRHFSEYSGRRADRPGLAVLVDVPGGRHAAHRGPGGGAARQGPRGARAGPGRPRHPPDRASLHAGARPASVDAARVRDPARRAPSAGRANGAVSNVCVHPVGRRRAAPRAAHRRLRRRPRPLARGARAGLGRRAPRPRAGRRHLPRLLDERLVARPVDAGRRGVRGASTGSPCGSRSPRRRRGPAGASTAGATGSSPTASHVPDLTRCRAKRADDGAARDRVRRPGRRAQGPAGAAARLRGAARPRPRAADARRPDARARSRRCCSTRAGSRRSARSTTRRSRAVLARADVLCAPSLGGESFGMVLTEAFAHGTPVVASDIAGYRDVVRDGVDGVLVPPRRRDRASPPRCATSRSTPSAGARWAPPPASTPTATPGRTSPPRSSPPTRRRSPCPRPATARRAPRRGSGSRPADGGPCGRAAAPAVARAGARPPLDRPAVAFAKRVALRPRRAARPRRRLVALQRIGVDAIVAVARRLRRPTWVLVGLGVMCASMVLRAQAWHAILRAALPARARQEARRAAGHDRSACSCPPRCRPASASPRAR